MNILFFSYDIPYPLTSGGKIRSFNLLKQLSKKHDVTLFCFYRTKEQLKELKHVSFLADIYPIKRRELESPFNLFYALFFPFPAALYFNPSIKKRLHDIVEKKNINAIHFESFYTSMYLDPSCNIPQILGTENIEWHVYQQYVLQQPAFVRQLLSLEIARIKRFEVQSWKKSTACLAVSENDRKEIRRNGVECDVVPNGIEPVSIDVNSTFGPTINFLFVGSLKYIQNKDALNWLVSSIWPPIREMAQRHNKNAILTVVGPETKSFTSPDSSLHIIGEVADIRKIYQDADILLAPIRAGGGTKFKILEAASFGIPIITTPGGIEGIEGLEDKKEIMVANSIAGFVDSADYLLSHEREAFAMAEKAKTTIELRYSWDTIGGHLRNFYERTVNCHH